jgi:hypothetical protein
MIAAAMRAGADEHVERFSDKVDGDGRRLAERRCCFHAAGNVIDCLPKRLQLCAKACWARSSRRRPVTTHATRSGWAARSAARNTLSAGEDRP